MKTVIILFKVIMIIVLTSCSGNIINTNENWEGFSKNTMRIYVRIYGKFDIHKDLTAARKKLIKKAIRRGSNLLKEYVLLNCELPKKREIERILKQGTLFKTDCTGKYCHTYMNFDISGLSCSNLRNEERKLDIKR